VFIDEGGLQLYMSILNTFINDSTVETKVLGLVNNIAEVPHLRTKLFNNDIIPTLRYLKLHIVFNVYQNSKGVND